MKKNLFYILLVAIIGYFTYFQNYSYPPKQFWDENYHIASAQKYIDRVMFMEPHPPLGKLLIALGELLLSPNKGIDKSSFLKTDYIRHFPKGMSFAGYRLFPTLFAWLNGVLFFLILYELTKHAFFSFLGSSLYLFDNALIVHSRAAMLESIQLFFLLGAIYYFVKKFDQKRGVKEYLLLGVWFGLALAVKANSAIALLLGVFWAFDDIKRGAFKVALSGFGGFVASAAMIFLALFYIHVALGQKVFDHRYYKASKEYKEIIKKGAMADPLNFFTMLRDNLKYARDYEKGVPKLNLCKKGENGSLFIGWPLGIKAISYRWERHGSSVQYIYLQGNPITWFLGIVAVILSFVLVVGRFLFGLEVKEKRAFDFIALFLAIYISYMIAISQIERVMYLYHYFIPLVLSYILAILLFWYLFKEYLLAKDRIVWSGVIGILAAIVFAWWYFSPLTYYKPLNSLEFNKRVWLKWWGLHAVR